MHYNEFITRSNRPLFAAFFGFCSVSLSICQHSIRSTLRLLNYICVPQQQEEGDVDVATTTLHSLQLLSRLHQLHDGQRALQLPMERLSRRLTAQSSPAIRNSIYEQLVQGELAGGDDQDELRTML